jgi:NADPH:quinone reductase-like Zn-dependent oxidoreductase
VLINGASGGVGTFAVQIAKAFGAEITAVVSTRKMEMMRSIGADHVIDYTQEDFTQKEQSYDLIFDTLANHSVSRLKRLLKPGGRYVTTALSLGALLLGPWLSISEGKKMSNMMARPNKEDWVFMAELLETGKVVPVIDRCYPLIGVAEALRYLGQGHARGKVLITVAHNDSMSRVTRNN